MRIWRYLQILLVTALLPWGIPAVQAGPGGGTYFANSPAGGATGKALRKFVDSLPGLGATNANNLGQYLPIATPVTGRTGVPTDGDYYEIGLVEYAEQLHSDLPKKTKLRGYVDLNPAFGNLSSAHNRAHYLGPVIVAKRDKPVRVKFTNLLPTGSAGNLFLPVDSSLMGAGKGPGGNYPSQFGGTVPAFSNFTGSYAQSRATLHLHGGNTPWISDGTPHQWTVPVGETSTPYQKGVSTRDVPDMPATGQGEMTFFYTNQQSGRLMFYHDHSLGITRLNVYAGEAAGYLLWDPVEDNLITTGILPNEGGNYRYGIPLIIQDKTFVPQNIDVQDALWNRNSKGVANNWGSYGDLWFPHVYEANQDPTSPDGANPFGRWDYGPWFWPPVTVDAAHATIPEPSTTPEAFMDTPLVNGTAYPYLNVEPKAYRFRILNASNDRTYNLSLFQADPADPAGSDVRMVQAAPPMAGSPSQSCPANAPPNPATGLPANCWPSVWPTDGRAGGVPDPNTAGPAWLQIGSEGGFLPDVAVIPPTPIGYEYNRRNIVVLNVASHGLYLQPAERADVVVDFSQFAGKTVILYNDGPAPTPGFDTRYDYYTGDPDQTSTGGAPSTRRGYGPNTRTIMQFRVGNSVTNPSTPSTPFNLAALQAALPTAFQQSQPAPIVPEASYPPASGGNGPSDMYAKIQQYSLTYNPVGGTVPLTIPFQPKAIQELWDPFGRMNATLGVELPFTTQLNQTTIPMGYAEPTTENIIDGQPQIWKITHNGVDTHPVHFHMMNVQLINRVGWDGAIRPPDQNELGWKEVVKMNPLEDAIVALVPKAQSLPWAVPTSTRPIDPTMPANATISTTDFGNLAPQGYAPQPGSGTPTNGLAVTVSNTPGGNSAGYDYGQEYVWHCHILGHEENDFMRPLVFRSSTAAPPAPSDLTVYPGGTTVPGLAPYVNPYLNPFVNQVVLQWTDNAPVSTPSSFHVMRNGSNIADISFLPGYPPIYTDSNVAPGSYSYQVVAFNAAGSSSSNTASVASLGSWTPATAVTLTASRPSPHVVGSNVQFIASASGATTTAPNSTVAYQYRFWLDNGSGPVLVQDYGFGDSWTLPAGTGVGSYTVTVDARTSAAVSLDVSSSLPYQVVPPPQPPVTIASPIPGTYASGPIGVTLTASTNSPPATIYYTTDGTVPTTASSVYSSPITVTGPTIINYFAVDANDIQEQPYNSNSWSIHTSDLQATVLINNGADVTNSAEVTLSLNAYDPLGVATMQFSNDGVLYSAEEPYIASKAWTLAPGDGFKTVYVRFRDKTLPSGVLYPPEVASITLATVAPVTTASPIAGTYAAPVTVRLNATSPSTIYYTTDGSTPTTKSARYSAPIPVSATTTLRYFAVDTLGNTEQEHSGTWTITVTDPAAGVQINGGSRTTRTPLVTLGLTATGAISMMISNDGVNWNAEQSFAASVPWTLTPGEGLKTVYVRYRDAANNLQPPVAASITMGIKDGIIPGTTGYLSSALRALQFANHQATPSDLDLAHGDVAPYAGGSAQPDDKLDALDVYTLLMRSVNLITTF